MSMMTAPNTPIVLPQTSPRELYLDANTAYREDSKYYDRCRFDFETLLVPDGFQAYLSLVTFVGPHSMMTVHEFNNTLQLNDLRVTLDHGNYTRTDLLAAINRLVPGTFSFNTNTWTLTYTSTVYTMISGSLNQILGFDDAQTGKAIVANHMINFTSEQSIFVLTDMRSSNRNIDSNKVSSAAVFAHIPLTTRFGGVIQYQESNPRVGLLLDDTELQSIVISLESETRNPLLFQLPYKMTLQVRFIATGRTRLQLDRPDGLRAPPGSMY